MPNVRVVVTHPKIYIGGQMVKEGAVVSVSDEDSKVLIGMKRARPYNPDSDAPSGRGKRQAGAGAEGGD